MTHIKIDQLWELLLELGTMSNPEDVVELLSSLLPSEEIDRLFKRNDLQNIHRLLYALVVFIREKKKEAKSRGVKSFYGN